MSQATEVSLTWHDGLRFTGGAAGRPQAEIDGHGATAASPVLMLLLAAASCSGSDVVLILEKMRVKLEEFRVDVSGVRRAEDPKRFLSMHLIYHIRGEGLDEVKARRAIDLSLERYCSVTHSLAADLVITYDLALS